MRQRIITFWIFLIMLCIPSVTVCAEDDSRNYLFELTANGANEIQVNTGDLITLTLKLKRTDSDQPADIYGMQDEIMYDSSFFELVEDSIIVASGVETAEIALRDGYKAFYMNFVSMAGGESWEPEKVLGTFQLKVIGTGGVSMIKNENYLVSCKDGKETYTASAVDVRAILSTECIVTFHSVGGSVVPEQVVQYGEKIKAPEKPVREGYLFTGWFKDFERTELWDFEKDIVKGNLDLYAGWEEVSEAVDEPSEEVDEPSGAVDDPTTGDGVCIWMWVLLVIILIVSIYVIKKKYFENKKNN